MSKLNEKKKETLRSATNFLCHIYDYDIKVLSNFIVADAEGDTTTAIEGLIAVKEFCEDLIKDLQDE